MIKLLLALALIIQGPPGNASVEGLVVRDGTSPFQVLVNARLELAGLGEHRIARSDRVGQFAFRDVPPGVYTLAITKDGYLRKNPGIRLEVKPNQAIRGIVFRLESAPTIEGMIRDPEGIPLFNVTVQALRTSFDSRGRRGLSLFSSARTDERGIFRLYWLDPGDYFLSATAPPPRIGTTATTVFVPTYFPGFVDIDDAKPIHLDLGRDLSGMDFALVRQAPVTLTGFVTSLATGKTVATGVDVVPPSDGAGVSRFHGQSNPATVFPPGEFTIRGVFPGFYIVSAIEGNEAAATRVRIRFDRAGRLAADSKLIVNLAIGPGVTVSGRLGNATQMPMDLRAARIQLTELDEALPQPTPAAIGQDGAFTIASVQPGNYTVSVSGLPGDLYMKNAAYLSADALAKSLSVAYGINLAKDGLVVEIGTDGGQITGAVLDGNNAPLPGAEVVLRPDAVNRFRLDRYRTTITDPDGRFVIHGIIPGDYTLYGWSSIEPNAHLDVEYMRPFESLGTPVQVTPGENPAVRLRALQADR